MLLLVLVVQRLSFNALRLAANILQHGMLPHELEKNGAIDAWRKTKVAFAHSW